MLLFTVLLNMVAATVIESATLQSRVASSDQFYAQALHLADGIANQLLVRRANFPDSLPTGEANCAAGVSDPICVRNTLNTPDLAILSGALVARYRVLRNEPVSTMLEVNEVTLDSTAATATLEAALYEIEVNITAVSGVGAEVTVALGVAVPVDGRAPFGIYWREPGADAL